MKLKLAFLLVLAVGVVLTGCATKPAPAPPEAERGRTFAGLVVQQDGITVVESDGCFFLRRKPFKLVATLTGDSGFYIHTSENRVVYDMAARGIKMNDLLAVDGRWMGGAEYQANAKKSLSLLVDEKTWQYWYASDEKNTFDQIIRNADKSLTCARSIETVYNGSSYVAVSDSRLKSVYLVITDVTSDDAYTKFSEHYTVYKKLVFLD